MKFAAAAAALCMTAEVEAYQGFRWGPGGYHNAGWCRAPGLTAVHADVNGDGKSDLICDYKGNHWIMLSGAKAGYMQNLGLVKGGWCGHAGATTHWADVNGDGKMDMICDDTAGRHWV